MFEPSPADGSTSVSSVSDLDSILFSPQATESVVEFTPVSERLEPFENIQYRTPQSVEGVSLTSRMLPSGLQTPILVQHPKYYMQENMVVFQVSIVA